MTSSFNKFVSQLCIGTIWTWFFFSKNGTWNKYFLWYVLPYHRKYLLLPGPHNLRSFLAANLTQSYFLIAHMFSFLWHSRQNFLHRKLIEREEIKRQRENVESESVSIFSFSLHFLFIFSFFLHCLTARLPGWHKLCNPDLLWQYYLWIDFTLILY